MKFSALAIATLTSAAAAHLIPESHDAESGRIVLFPAGSQHEHEGGRKHHHDGPHPGNGHEFSPGKSHRPGGSSSSDGDDFKVIHIAPDQHSRHHDQHKPPPIPPKHEKRPPPVPERHHTRPPYGKDRPEHGEGPKHVHRPEHRHGKEPGCKHGHHGHHEERPKHHHPHPHPHPQPHPHPHPGPAEKCIPGTYACTANRQTGVPGWEVCNTGGQFQYAGDCPPNTVCKYYQPSKSPYCVPQYFQFP